MEVEVLANALITRLERGVTLSDQDRATLLSVVKRTRQIGPGEDLIREGDRPSDVRVILKGWACRYKMLTDGRRQIMGLLLPGDFCDLLVAILKEMDHSIATLSEATIVDIPRTTVEELTDRHPTITRALWWATLVDEGVMREWLVNMGQRPAEQSMAHLFCELLARLRVVGLNKGASYAFPLTQQDLGDALGLSAIHVNRVLQQLRGQGLIEWKKRVLTVLDEAGLTLFAGFKRNYLHLDPR